MRPRSLLRQRPTARPRSRRAVPARSGILARRPGSHAARGRARRDPAPRVHRRAAARDRCPPPRRRATPPRGGGPVPAGAADPASRTPAHPRLPARWPGRRDADPRGSGRVALEARAPQRSPARRLRLASPITLRFQPDLLPYQITAGYTRASSVCAQPQPVAAIDRSCPRSHAARPRAPSARPSCATAASDYAARGAAGSATAPADGSGTGARRSHR